MPPHLPAYAPGTSIALISSLVVAQMIAASALADLNDAKSTATASNVSMALPVIGNTTELDRSLSREVSDTFVFGQNEQSESVSVKYKSTDTVREPSSTKIQNTTPVQAAQTAQEPVENRSDDHSTGSSNDVIYTQTLSESDAWKNDFDDTKLQNQTVWQHILQSDRVPLPAQERVKFYIDQYQRESLWISKILHRGAPFLAHMVATLDQRFLPVELALLPAIESGYQPTAKSGGNAAGLWQIVPITAKEIGLDRNNWFDGRGDVLTSTTAAIDYLSYLNAEFDGDWELTLAAYNAGPGRIRAAIRKNKANGLPTDYWSLDLPRETQNYVPKFT